MKKTVPAFMFLILGLAGCATLPEFTAQYPTQRITVGPGPEDMVADTFAGRRRLLVSCDERRDGRAPHAEIWSVSLEDGKAAILPRRGEPGDHFSFHPHGADIYSHKGNSFLVLVNHNRAENRHSLLSYAVRSDGLYWLSEVYADKMHIYRRYAAQDEGERTDTCTTAGANIFTSANDVCASPDGALLWTNDLSRYGRMGEALFGIKSGWTGRYKNCEDYRKTRYKVAYPNGLAFHNSDLFISTTRQNKVLRYPGGNMDLKPEKVAVAVGGDNITVSRNELLVTAHLRPLLFLKHRKDPAVRSPSTVYAIHPQSGERRVLYADDGSRISAASTAIRIGNTLYLCQVFDDFILRVELP
ncbi:MAG: hypothetical protein IBJ09_06685 [Bacteroidia bacterium]|nr:hypothetical protein [Bacteroidia bacterium]